MLSQSLHQTVRTGTRSSTLLLRRVIGRTALPTLRSRQGVLVLLPMAQQSRTGTVANTHLSMMHFYS